MHPQDMISVKMLENEIANLRQVAQAASALLAHLDEYRHRVVSETFGDEGARAAWLIEELRRALAEAEAQQ